MESKSSRARRPAVQAASRMLMAGVLLSLAACGDRTDKDASAERKVDSAVQKTQDATVAAARKAAELAEKARDNTKAYFESPKAREDAAAVKETLRNAGGALVTTADDAAITASVSAALVRDPELDAGRIEVDTKDGAVRLRGVAPNAQAKARAETIAKAVKGVNSVDNKLELGVTN